MRTPLKVIGLMVIACAAAFLLAGCGGSSNPGQPSGSAPAISLFAADNYAITLGTQTILRWQVDDSEADVRIDPAPGNVPAVGSASIAPVGTSTYTLLATNKNGTTQRFVTISVR